MKKASSIGQLISDMLASDQSLASKKIEVKSALDRLNMLRDRKKAVQERITELDNLFVEEGEQAVDPVSIALGEIAAPLPICEELRNERESLVNINKAIDLQAGRLLEVECQAAFIANSIARPQHIAACQKLLAAALAFSEVINEEREVRSSLNMAGYTCYLEPCGEALELPVYPLSELGHYITIHTASHDEKQTGLALVDLPQHGARCGENVTVSRVEAAHLMRSGWFDPSSIASITNSTNRPDLCGVLS